MPFGARTVAIFLSLSGVAALVTGVALRWRRSRLPGFAWNRPVLSEADYAALCARPGWRGVAVPAASPGPQPLRGLLRPPKTEGAPWIVFFQGNSQRLLGEGQEFLEAVAGAEDLGLAVVAWRGFDGSPGRAGRDAMVADAPAVLRWLHAHEARGGALHVVSFSLGALPAAAAVASLQGATGPGRARTLTLLAPYTSLRMFEPGLAKYYADEVFDALPALARVEVPVLVVHGEGDQVLPVAMGRAVAEALGSRGRLLVLPGAGHLDLLTDQRAREAVLAAVLSRPLPAAGGAPLR